MLASQLEIIEQALSYLESVSEEDYTAIMSPNFISSAGSHMRHIIDHYQAIIIGINNDLIDYDVRERGSNIESSPVLAMNKLNEIGKWIRTLSENQLNTDILVVNEVSVSNKKVQQVKSSVARELMFASSHAIHHYAMIAQICFAQNILLPKSFGIAPSTATFLRKDTKPLNTIEKSA